MAGKHYVIATQSGYIVNTVTGYPEEFASRSVAVKALAELVRDAAERCRRSHKTCSVVGTARGGDVQIRVGGRQGYHLWDRYTISERPGSRKPPKESALLRELRAGSKPVHSTKKSPAQLQREIDEALAGASGAHSLYKELVAAGVPIDHHESDLYVLDTRVARGILKAHGKTGSPFTSQIDGKRWLDVPFAYEPFWEKKSRAR